MEENNLAASSTTAVGDSSKTMEKLFKSAMPNRPQRHSTEPPSSLKRPARSSSAGEETRGTFLKVKTGTFLGDHSPPPSWLLPSKENTLDDSGSSLNP